MARFDSVTVMKLQKNPAPSSDTFKASAAGQHWQQAMSFTFAQL